MTNEQEIGAIIDEMYAMISGPAGLRDWSRQANCFLPEARQVRTGIDEHGRPVMKAMSLEEYARDTTPFFAANPFYEIETDRRIDVFGNIAHAWSHYEPARRRMMRSPSAAGSTRSSYSAIPSMAGASST